MWAQGLRLVCAGFLLEGVLLGLGPGRRWAAVLACPCISQAPTPTAVPDSTSPQLPLLALLLPPLPLLLLSPAALLLQVGQAGLASAGTFPQTLGPVPH